MTACAELRLGVLGGSSPGIPVLLCALAKSRRLGCLGDVEVRLHGRNRLRLERIRDPRRRPLLVLVTDGRATHGPDAVSRSRLIADRLRQTGVASLLIDCESGRMALGLAQRLSVHLGAQYVTVGEVAADQLVAAVRQGRAA